MPKKGGQVADSADVHSLTIKTISEMISNEKDLQLYQIEPKAPGRIITCFFSTCYFTLGKAEYSVSFSFQTIWTKSNLNVK